MRPEKSKLLKISLCVLSCVFFGCGDNKSNGGGAGKVLTVEKIKQQLDNNTNGKNAQQENSPFEKILSKAMTKVLGRNDNADVQTIRKYINDDGSIKPELEDGSSEERNKFVDALEKIVDAINTEVEKSLKNYKLKDGFDVTENAINAWTEKGLKNRKVAKVISAWQVIYSEYSRFIDNPLRFLIKSGKGLMHRSTVKAIDLALRNFVEFLKNGCDECEKSLEAVSRDDEKATEEVKNVTKAISEDLSKVRGFVENSGSIRTNILKKVYTLIGNKFLPGYGDQFFGLINVQQAKIENPEQKVTTDWGNAVFNHFYLGLKSARTSFSNPASALNGHTMSKLKKKQYEKPYKGYWDAYNKLLEKFVLFAINENIIPKGYLKENKVSDICRFLDDKGKNSGVDKISLSPWLMLCAQKNWKEINGMVQFVENDNKWKVVFKNGFKDIEDLVKKDTNYEKLDVYAGILAFSNLFLGLNKYGNNGTNTFGVSDDLMSLAKNSMLKKYVLNGRLKQWEDFKTAAEKGTLKDEE